MEGERSPVSCTTFNQMRLEGKHLDVTLRVGGVEFDAHKIILCRCSNFFRTLFSSRWNTTDKRVHKISGVSPEMMELIMEYAYRGTVPVTADNVESLLITADYLRVRGIIRLCCEFLKSQLCLDNCLGIWKFTDTYYCPELRAATCVFILQHFKEISEVSPEFVELSAKDLKELLEKYELNVRQERAVFEAVLKWVAHDPQSRRQHVLELLGKVRLALLPLKYLLNKVKFHEYVRGSKECRLLITEALTEMYRVSSHSPAPDYAHALSRPRLPHAVLLAIGGWSGNSLTNALETYDARADRWLNVTRQHKPCLAYHGVACLEGYVYVVGGFNSLACLNAVKRLDPVGRRWQEVAPMHSPRCYVSAAVLAGDIYAMGGFDGHARLRSAERYRPQSNQWSRIASMHQERSDASATALRDKVYICGGFNGHECLTTVEVYSPTTDQWTFIAPMSMRRSVLVVIAYGDEVYVVGGFNGSIHLQSVEVYNPATNAWRRITGILSPRSNFGIQVLEDRLLVAGGFKGFSTAFSTEYYDKDSGEWSDSHDVGVHRSALGCAAVPRMPNLQEYTAPRGPPPGTALLLLLLTDQFFPVEMGTAGAGRRNDLYI